MEVLAALIPSAGVGFLFYLAIKAIIGADRKERAAMAALDAAERGKAPETPAPKNATPSSAPD
jgi:hypothetical protein